jgi:membrane protease YdiL (CAAX protease family)
MNEKKKTIIQIIIFVSVTLLAGYAGKVLDNMISNNVNTTNTLGQLLWLSSPLICALILDWKAIKSCIQPHFKNNIFLYALSFVILPGIYLIAIMTGLVLHIAKPTITNASELGQYMVIVFASIAPIFIKNIFEEFAWRGFLTTKIFQVVRNRFMVHFITGIVWGLWHIPYYTTVMAVTSESQVTLIPRFLVGVVLIAIISGEIRIRSQSVWPSVIMHTMGNAFINPLLLNGFLIINKGKENLLAPTDGYVNIMIYLLCTFVMMLQLKMINNKVVQDPGTKKYGD